jgi:AcrR family transcriptional regulator
MHITDSPAREPRPMRADARHNDARLLSAAAAAFAEHGPSAPLDDIAPRAGVGIGTLYRHFPTRQALLVALFLDSIRALGAEAEALLDAPSPGDALGTWLRAVLAHNLMQRGLKKALMAAADSPLASACKEQMSEAGAVLLARAQQAVAIRPDVDIGDLLRFVHGIALATEHASDEEGVERAYRLLALMVDGRKAGAVRGTMPGPSAP